MTLSFPNISQRNIRSPLFSRSRGREGGGGEEKKTRSKDISNTDEVYSIFTERQVLEGREVKIS